MEITSKQFNTLAVKKKSRGLEERVNKKFEIAYNEISIKENIKELIQKMATKDDLLDAKNEILTAINNLDKQLKNTKIMLVAQRRAFVLNKKM